MSPDVLHLEVITPSKQLFSGEVAQVSLNTTRGQIEVLPGHAEMVAVLDIGVAHLDFPGGFGYALALHGGIMQVHPGQDDPDSDEEELDVVRILASEGEHPEHIDIERAEAAQERALEALAELPQTARQRIIQDRLRAEARLGAFKSFRKASERRSVDRGPGKP
jgi:F-type H+-transporting ATPase subunit epsilon